MELVVTRRRNPHRFLAVLSSLLVVLWAGVGGSLGAWAGVFRVPVFTSGTEGYHTFRIPAILRAANGDLLAFAEGRRNSSADHGDVDLVMKRSRDNGLSWSPLELVQDAWDAPTQDITIGNPAPVVDWMDSQHPGRIYFNAREHQGTSPGNRAVAYSSDGGLTYDASFADEPNIETPVVQNSAIRFASTIEGDGQNILIYSSPGQWDERADMTIRVSLDEGVTWGMETIIHPGSAAYSDLIKLNSEQIGILYEVSNYQQIIFGYFDYEDLDPAPWNGIEGDIDQNGILDESDLDAYIAAWTPITNEYYLGGIDSYCNGDLNFDGKNDLDDVYWMRRALLAAGLSAAPLAALMAGVPEPSSMTLFVSAVVFWMISLSLTCKRGG